MIVLYLLSAFLLQTEQREQFDDFTSAFNAIASDGSILGFGVDEKFDALDKERGFNHFQGIQRLKGTHYFCLSSNTHKKGALFHIVKVSSKPMLGKLGSNLNVRELSPTEDKIVCNYVISEDHNHAGGIQIVGNFLAVPVENSSDSRIMFFDLKVPERPKKLATEIIRKNKTAGAVGIYKERDYYVVLVLSKKLEVYYSSRADLKAANFELKYTLNPEDLPVKSDSNASWAGYQNLHLFIHSDRRVYLLGFYNNTRRVLRAFSTDYADLFRFEIDEPAKVTMTKVATVRFVCQKGILGERFCNFDAGAGACWDDQAGLIIYAVEDKPKNGMVRFVEFSAASFQKR